MDRLNKFNAKVVSEVGSFALFMSMLAGCYTFVSTIATSHNSVFATIAMGLIAGLVSAFISGIVVLIGSVVVLAIPMLFIHAKFMLDEQKERRR